MQLVQLQAGKIYTLQTLCHSNTALCTIVHRAVKIKCPEQSAQEQSSADAEGSRDTLSVVTTK